jgi:predicted PurR-regulated permease PerM
MTDSQKWFIVAGSVVVGVLLYLLAPVLTPFIVAATLAYMGDPLTDVLERHMPRAAAVSIVFALIITVLLLLLLVLVPMIERQISTLLSKLPVYLDRLQNVFLPWLMAKVGQFDIALDLESIKRSVAKSVPNAGGIAAKLVSTVTSSGLALIGVIANIVLIPVLTFYLLRDWDLMVERIHELIPRRFEQTVSSLAKESDSVLGAFLRGQISVMAALGLIYSVGLWMVGLDLALLIGSLAGLVSFVPYLGFIVGIAVAGVAAMLQFQDVMFLAYIAIVFGVGQIAESFLLTPLLVGDRIGLHPVAVMFAVMAGGQLFGFFGILLALPIAAVLMVMLRHAHERYVQSHLYGGLE